MCIVFLTIYSCPRALGVNEIDKWIEQIKLHILALIVLTIRITQTTLTPTPTHTQIFRTQKIEIYFRH